MTTATITPPVETLPYSAELNLASVENAIHSSSLLNALEPAGWQKPWHMKAMVENAEQAYETDPALVELFLERDIEGLHATRSGSLLSILSHGIIPANLHNRLGAPVITGEYYSQPSPRTVTHLVHWLYASSTYQFAEAAISPATDSGLSIHNYQDARDVDDAYIEPINPLSAVRTHLEKQKKAALLFETWLQSGKATEAELEMHRLNFPVLIGFSLDGLDTGGLTAQPRSSVNGDLTLDQIIPAANLKLIAVPEAHISYLEKYTQNSTITVIALERIRKSIPFNNH